MNVTELRQRLQDLEREGNGRCRVEVAPTPPPREMIASGNLNGFGIDFAAQDYAVTEIIIQPWQHGNAITLHFTATTPAGVAPNGAAPR